MEVWHAETSECVMTMLGHRLGVSALTQLDVNLLASASDDGELEVWEPFIYSAVRAAR